MRNFNEADKKKKQARIQIEENPGNLSEESLLYLEDMVKTSLKDGCLSCPVAWRIAKKANIPKIAVGEITDKLGIRITNCQIGCFKVDKTIHEAGPRKTAGDKTASILEMLAKNDELTCVSIFELSKQIRSTPIAIADVANLKNLKIKSCQLGCF